MAANLRITSERMLVLNSSWLNPRIGCGLMLTRIPPYQGNDVFRDVMRGYNYPNLFADKPAAKILDDDEELMRQFVVNAESGKMPLKNNFRAVYAVREIYLALDTARRAAYFLAAPENRLILTNYYRDVMPGIAKLLKVSVGGSVNRLTPVGWQNLHDVLNDANFRKDFPGIQKIEVMASLPNVRWRNPVLELGVNLLNFSTPRALRDSIRSEVSDQSGSES